MRQLIRVVVPAPVLRRWHSGEPPPLSGFPPTALASLRVLPRALSSPEGGHAGTEGEKGAGPVVRLRGRWGGSPAFPDPSFPILWAGLILLFLIVIPGGLTVLSGMPPALLPALALSTFLLQAGAAGTGPVGGNGVAELLVVTSFGLGNIAAEFEMPDRIAHHSPRVSAWISGMSRRAGEIRFLPRFGMFLLLPLMWMPGIGLYGGVVVAWVLRWDRMRSFAVLALGWMLACGAVYLLVGQVLHFFGG